MNIEKLKTLTKIKLLTYYLKILMNKLEQLKQRTTVVADTGDFEIGKQYQVQDATTNPTLILQAATKPEYQRLLEDAVRLAKENKELKTDAERLGYAIDACCVNFGLEWLKFIPGKVSTEVDSSLSFDTEATVNRGRRLIKMYEDHGVNRSRILLKIAGTWEGIEAAKILEKEGIQTNITLIFSLIQAVAAAQNANAYLISPFVGRILDWHKLQAKIRDPNTEPKFKPEEDPGVISVREVYRYFKTFGLKTIVMGASFRNTEEIEELNGCDNLTISPSLMEKLRQDTGHLSLKLSPEMFKLTKLEKIETNEKNFRWLLNEDQCATEKLSEGIRNFNKDTRKLEVILNQLMTKSKP